MISLIELLKQKLIQYKVFQDWSFPRERFLYKIDMRGGEPGARCSITSRPSVTELHVKSMYKIYKRGKGGSKNRVLGNYRCLCTKLMERGGGGNKKF